MDEGRISQEDSKITDIQTNLNRNFNKLDLVLEKLNSKLR